MKKLWTKFKHWLIKKLGGYVNAPVRPIIHQYGEHEVIKLTVSTKAEARYWFGTPNNNYRDTMKLYASRALAAEIYDHADELFKIDVDDTPKFDTDAITVRATVHIVKAK